MEKATEKGPGVQARKVRILLTNDDGIASPGLYALYEELRRVGEVIVVAPDGERSAVGHAITISEPLRVWPYEKNGKVFGYAVAGTPADCVKIAFWALLKDQQKPSLVVSGINLGSNTGINAIYSGTVSAATEGAILGVPSFAISLTTYENPDYGPAARFARSLARLVLKKGLPKGVYLNVNVPAVPAEQIRGVVITSQGQAVYREQYQMRRDPRGRAYYWLTGTKIDLERDESVDDGAIQQNKVSVTPIHYDLTNYAFIEELKRWNITWSGRPHGE
ncbi:MAG: 5'/3'-nucleotidase SurE [candidate division KSB1 bacterium]|nr:5'/3'-nucleotidase SurE [candidate division KSB1 bacterium]